MNVPIEACCTTLCLQLLYAWRMLIRPISQYMRTHSCSMLKRAVEVAGLRAELEDEQLVATALLPTNSVSTAARRGMGICAMHAWRMRACF